MYRKRLMIHQKLRQDGSSLRRGRAVLKLVRCRVDSCAPAHLKLVRCPRSLAPTLVTLPSMSLIPFAPLKLVRVPRSLAATLAALPSMSLFPKAPFDLSVLPIYVARVPAAPFTHCFPRSFRR